MSKSEFQKALEKQLREEKKLAKQAQLRDRAQAIISGTEIIEGFRVMDKEAEDTLVEILNQYDKNKNNYVNFSCATLPRHLQDSFSLQCEKLQMYGQLTRVTLYMGGAMITLSESGKNYFLDKENAYKIKEEKARREISTIQINNVRKEYDVFISHANRDKNEYVNLLSTSVKKLGINVFYDSEVLSWGDDWKDIILKGTSNSEFAIIVISNNFFGREWTEKELNEFLNQQNQRGQKIILPLLYNISLEELKRHYPELSDIQCVHANEYSEDEIAILLAKELIKRYKN